MRLVADMWYSRRLEPSDFFVCVCFCIASFAQSLPLVAQTEVLNNSLGGASKPEVLTLFWSGTLLFVGLLKPLYSLTLLRKAPRSANVCLCVVWALCLCATGAAQSLAAFLGAMLISQTCMGFVETALDGTLAASATKENAVSLEAMALSARWIGTLVASVAALTSPTRMSIFAAALVPIALGVLLHLRMHFRGIQLPTSEARPRDAFWQPSLLSAAAFVFIRNLPPTEGDSWIAYLSTRSTAFSYTLTSAAATFGAVLAGAFVRPTQLLIAGPVLAMVVGCSRAAICYFEPVPVLVIMATEMAVNIVDSLSTLSLIVVAALGAPRKATAAGFSFVMLSNYAGDQISAFFSSWLIVALGVGNGPGRSFAGLPALILVSRTSGLLPLLALPLARRAIAPSSSQQDSLIAAPSA
jgi:hypothetical protein